MEKEYPKALYKIEIIHRGEREIERTKSNERLDTKKNAKCKQDQKSGAIPVCLK